MKIDEETKEVLYALILIGDEIYDIYEAFTENGVDDAHIKTLRELFQKEEMLYKKLELSTKKMYAICDYFRYNEGIEFDKKIPSILNDGFSKDTYPFYRIIAKCRYKTINEVTTFNIDLKSFRAVIRDIEVLLTFNTSLKSVSKGKDKKIMLWNYLNLMDSETTEKQLLESNFAYSESVVDMSYMSVCNKIDDQRDFVSAVKKENYVVLGETYEDIYERVMATRVNEVFSMLLYNLIVFAKFCGGKCEDDLYEFVLLYTKSIVALCSDKTRGKLYEDLYKNIGENSEDRIMLMRLLNESIEDIETNIVPSITRISMHKRLTT